MSSQLKIAVYTMAKNEAEHVERYAETTKEADIVVVTDTGSTDDTPALLEKSGISVKHARISPWRFDIATNCALANVPDDVDVCVKLDLDEVIHTNDGGSWREELERLWVGDINQLNYWYTWSWHVRGKVPAVRFVTGHVHSRHGFLWRHPGHAMLSSSTNVTRAMSDNFEIHHYMTGKSRPDYMSLLQLAVHECKSPRTLFYLGREYSFRKMHVECINTLNEYLTHPDAVWKAERANAMRLISVSYEALGQTDTAFSWLMRAHGELPNIRDLWYETGRFLHNQGDFLGGIWAFSRCLVIEKRHPEWVAHTGSAWDHHPYLLAAKCAWHLNNKDKARSLLATAKQIAPDDHDIRSAEMLMSM